jgi:NADH dehydrogenase [ubiquinone] 1 alpha subcomplex assembly factor 7
MFGELIGLCFAETWKAMGKPEEFGLLELGPGRGTLMDDALRATAKIHGFHSGMDLLLLETNKTLIGMQKEKLISHRPHYIDDVEQMPPLPSFIIANEFFDALPVRQFEKAADGWRERLVAVDGDELEFVLSPPDPSFLFFIPTDRRDAPAGTVHEVCLPGLTMMQQIAKRIMKYGGAALIIDYGYAAPPGTGTLQAVSSHRHADVLERPGEVDLTFHVDFAALKQIGQAKDAVVLGPIGQGEFLKTLGIDVRAAQLKHEATPDQATAIDAAVRRLTHDDEMGCLFKAMAIVSPQLGAMPGF